MKPLSVAVCTLLLGGCADLASPFQSQSESDGDVEKIEALSRELDELRRAMEQQRHVIDRLSLRLDAIELAAKETERVQGRISEFREAIARPAEAGSSSEEGEVLLHEDIVTYSAGERIQSENMSISSPTGVLVSDAERRIVGGDLEIVSGGNLVTAENAIVERRGDRIALMVSKPDERNAEDAKIEPHVADNDKVDQPPP